MLGPRSRTQAPATVLSAYRAAVQALVEEVADQSGPGASPTRPDLDRLADQLADRVRGPELVPLLATVAGGTDAVAGGLASEVRRYRPSDRSSARDLPSLVRIYLLSQIDAAWWGTAPRFEADADVQGSPDLVALDPLRRRHLLSFRYRQQPRGLPGRARDWAERRVLPNRRPRTSGLLFTRARPELVAFLNGLAHEFATAAPLHTPPLWVTSLVRSVQHQQHLRTLGYAAVLPSAHCTGYAADVEMQWFRTVGGAGTLADLLLERQAAGQANVIDEGQAWHVCVSPEATEGLRRTFAASMG